MFWPCCQRVRQEVLVFWPFCQRGARRCPRIRHSATATCSAHKGDMKQEVCSASPIGRGAHHQAPAVAQVLAAVLDVGAHHAHAADGHAPWPLLYSPDSRSRLVCTKAGVEKQIA